MAMKFPQAKKWPFSISSNRQLFEGQHLSTKSDRLISIDQFYKQNMLNVMCNVLKNTFVISNSDVQKSPKKSEDPLSNILPSNFFCKYCNKTVRYWPHFQHEHPQMLNVIFENEIEWDKAIGKKSKNIYYLMKIFHKYMLKAPLYNLSLDEIEDVSLYVLESCLAVMSPDPHKDFCLDNIIKFINFGEDGGWLHNQHIGTIFYSDKSCRPFIKSLEIFFEFLQAIQMVQYQDILLPELSKEEKRVLDSLLFCLKPEIAILLSLLSKGWLDALHDTSTYENTSKKCFNQVLQDDDKRKNIFLEYFPIFETVLHENIVSNNLPNVYELDNVVMPIIGESLSDMLVKCYLNEPRLTYLYEVMHAKSVFENSVLINFLLSFKKFLKSYHGGCYQNFTVNALIYFTTLMLIEITPPNESFKYQHLMNISSLFSQTHCRDRALSSEYCLFFGLINLEVLSLSKLVEFMKIYEILGILPFSMKTVTEKIFIQMNCDQKPQV